MLGSLERGDRFLLIGAAVLFAIVTALAALLGRPASEDGEPVTSSWSGTPGGGLAAYRLLGRVLDAGVVRWERSPEELEHETLGWTESRGVTLLVALPTVQPTRRERDAVEKFVRTGGRLVVIGDALGLAPGAVTERATGQDTLTWLRADSNGVARRAARVRMRATARWSGALPDEGSVRFAQHAMPGVVEYPLGLGTVVWWAGPLPVANRGLLLADNLALFLDSVGSPEGEVLWDEYFHGSRGEVMGYLLRTPLKWAIVQVLLVFAVVCFTWARRFVPARVPASESRASRLEFVDALGGLYARAGAAAVAARELHDDVRLRLVRRLGLPAAVPSAVLAAAAARRLGVGGPALAQLLDRTAHAGDEDAGTTVGEALTLVQALDQWDRRWQTVAGAERTGDDTRTEGA